MRLKGVKTMRQAARWLVSRWGQQALILGYHRVADVDYDPYGVNVRPSHFAGQMAALCRDAQPISLAQLREGLQTGQLPRRAVVVTFDDGYVDMLYQVRPVLTQYEIPAAVFVVAGQLGQELWWDKLARLILTPAVLPDTLRLEINGHWLTWSLYDPPTSPLTKQITPRRRLLQMLYQELLAQPEAHAATLSELRAWSSATSPNPNDTEAGRVMSGEELVTLARSGLIEVGSHTMTHTPLTTLPVEAQAAEIGQSKVALEKAIGKPVVSFSYPHGAVTAVAPHLVQEAGYTLTCASQNGMVRPGSEPFLLPRFWPSDIDGNSFARWLRLWL